MKSIETANYILAAGDGQGRGTYIIIRKADDACALRNTGSEALIAYKQFERALKRGVEYFDALCAKETYAKDGEDIYGKMYAAGLNKPIEESKARRIGKAPELGAPYAVMKRLPKTPFKVMTAGGVIELPEPEEREAALTLVRTLARMSYDGEEIGGKEFLMENDDAVSTLNNLIMDARNIVEGQPEAVEKRFTVLGLYEDTGQIFSHAVAAADIFDAMRKAAAHPAYNDTLVILGALPGEHTLQGPGCDNDKTAYASDLIQQED